MQSELDKATAEYDVAQMQSDQADRVKQDAFDKIQLAKQKIAAHELILQERKLSLQIISSVDGNFSTKVMRNGFVKRGHLLGEIR